MFLNGILLQVRSSLLPLSLLFIFHLGISIFLHFLIPICNSDLLFTLIFPPSEGEPVGKHGAARGNVTFGTAAHQLAATY